VQAINSRRLKMAFVNKTYAYKQNGDQVKFNGHISKATAKKRGFRSVTHSIQDTSGKGRGQDRHFYGPAFEGMPIK
jgi:hypothetical protein